MRTRSIIHTAATLGRRAMLLAMGIALVAAHTQVHAQNSGRSKKWEGRMNSLQRPHEVRLRGLPATV